MGIINNLFGNRSEAENEPKFNWNIISSSNDVTRVLDLSEENTIVIFKHSNRCGISSSVLRKFEKQAKDYPIEQNHFYLLNVNQYRSISNEISEQFSVRHESPQLIVIKNRKVIEHYSHYEVLNMNLSDH